MTPEQIVNAEAEIRKWFPPQIDGDMPIWRRALEMLVSAAQSAETYRANWQESERGRNALLAEREALRKECDEAKEQARLGWERAAEKDRAYGDMIAQRDEALARCARLSAAGQVLSEHVDKAPEWTIRDEFAKAALQGILANHTTQEKPDVCAKAAYMAADAMLTERTKP